MPSFLHPQTKIFSLSQLQTQINENPQAWRPLVFTNGCFDLLHAGHVRYLAKARELGQALVVGLNSDQSVASIKPQASITAIMLGN